MGRGFTQGGEGLHTGWGGASHRVGRGFTQGGEGLHTGWGCPHQRGRYMSAWSVSRRSVPSCPGHTHIARFPQSRTGRPGSSTVHKNFVQAHHVLASWLGTSPSRSDRFPTSLLGALWLLAWWLLSLGPAVSLHSG